jgi:16S rRNA (guanine527-N7)-methyltransferase
VDAGTVSEQAVRARLAAAGIAVADSVPAQLARYLALLERWNRVHNLTAVRGAAALIERHLVESLALGPLMRGTRIADVGSGAGLPGIPLAAAYPGLQFTLIESRDKRARFLLHVAGELGLGNVTVSHGRVEDLLCAEPFATVLARAVAPLAELVAMTRHLTAPGSILLVPTGVQTELLTGGLPGYVSRPVSAALVQLVRGKVVCLERTEG